MKNIKILFVTVSILLGLLLFGGCPDTINSSADKNVTITINADIQRSLMPNIPVFAKYELTFIPGAGQTEPSGNPIEVTSSSYSLALEPGQWSVSVKGFVLRDAVYYEAASSEPVDFNAGSGDSINVPVTIKSRQGGDPGIFFWDISFPEDVIAGTLEILDIFEQEIDGIEPIDLMEEENRSGLLSLESGYYFIKIELENEDNNWAYAFDSVHIYSNIETKADASTGYAFTAVNFTPMVTLEGLVQLTAEIQLSSSIPNTVTLYRDAEYSQEIATLNINNEGAWSYRFTSLYSNVYIKALVNYVDFDEIDRRTGPVNLNSFTNDDLTINAELISLAGTVLLDDEVDTEITPVISIYSQNDILIDTVNAEDGNWTALIHSDYDFVYLTATVDYEELDGFDFAEFELTTDLIDTTSENPLDWTINAELLRLSGNVVFSDADLFEPPTMSLYANLTDTDPIRTVNIVDGEWNAVITPNYKTVYLKAAIQYSTHPEFEITAGPVDTSSDDEQDWEIDAELIPIYGTVQLDNVIDTDTDNSPVLELYSAAGFNSQNLITTVNLNTEKGDDYGKWSAIITPNYISVYQRAVVDYLNYDTVVRTSGEVNTTTGTEAQWTINARLIHLFGTVQLDYSLIDTENPPIMELFTDAQLSNPVNTVNTVYVSTTATNGRWDAIIHPDIGGVYLKTTVKYVDYEEFTFEQFSLTPAGFHITSNPNAGVIDARLIRQVNRPIQMSNTDLDTDSPAILEVYSNLGFTNLIATTTIAKNGTDGSYTIIFTPNYRTVYLKATVQYEDEPVVERIKINVNAVSTVATDWLINCRLQNTGDIEIGDPSVLMYLNNAVTPLLNNEASLAGMAGSGIFTVSIASGSYTQILWYINGNLMTPATGQTEIIISKREAGIYRVTVETTTGGVKDSGTHSFVVQE